MAKRIDVEDIRQQAKNGAVVVAQTTLAVSEKTPPAPYAKKAGSFFRFVASDKTGKITVTYWGGDDKDKTEKLYQSIEKGDVVVVSNGTAANDAYVGDICIALNEGKSSLEKACNFDLADFLPVGKQDPEKMWAQLEEIRNSVKDTHLKKLLESAFSSPDLKKNMINLPAALEHHHNYVGGLVEHIVSVVKICDSLCSLYPNMDRDLLLTGAILHDLGKTREYEIKGATFAYRPEANYFGHITLCEQEVSKLIDSIRVPD